MSLFLDSSGQPTFKVDDVYYTLLMVSKEKQIIDTKNLQFKVQYCGDGSQYIRLYGENVYTHPVLRNGLVYWYSALENITYGQPKISAYVGGMLTGNLRGWLAPNGDNYYASLELIGDKLMDENVARKYSYKLDKVREKISSGHHYHVRLVDLYKRADEVEVVGPEALLLEYLDKFNQVEATHATFITYWRTVDTRIRSVFAAMMYCNNGIDMKWLKEEGKAAKQSAGLTDIKLIQLYEINVLVNRLDVPVDWAVEQEHRVRPELARIQPASIYKHATMLFHLAKLEGKQPVKMSYDEYWQQRSIAMPAGAIHDETPEINEKIKMLPRELKNKKGLASTLGDLPQDYFLQREKMINAYPSTKYEWGKTRALYGCDFVSHVHADFGLLACEETFPYFVPTGDQANNDYIKRVMKPYSTYIPVCYDYEDFNSQHSTENMKEVIKAWRDVYGDKLTDEQIASVNWTIESVDEQIVHDTINNTSYKTNGTLFSGWRLTSFINTALNYCYLAESDIDKYTRLHMHNGDDVYATVCNLKQAVDLYVSAKNNSIRANMTKMSIGTIAEFLRTDMRSDENSAEQYLARGISTFVHSRIESAMPLTYRNLVEAYKTRYEEVIARGGDDNSIRALYRKQLYFARSMFEVDKSIQEKILTYDTVCGGLIQNGVICNEELIEVSMDCETLEEQVLADYIKPGVTAYTTYLSKKFPQFTNSITKRSVSSSIISGYNTRRKTMEAVKTNMYEKYHMRSLRGVWRNMSHVALINRVRMGVNNIMVIISAISHDHAKALEKVNDPIAWLALLLKK